MDLTLLLAETRSLTTEEHRKQIMKINYAIMRRDHDDLKKLLSEANFNVIRDEYFGGVLLNSAIRLRDHVLVKLLLDQRTTAIPDCNQPQYLWNTSTLVRAIYSNNHKIVKLLINQRSDPDTNTPCDYWYDIINQKDLSNLECLLKCRGRKIANDEWSKKLFLAACGLGSFAIVSYFLDQGLSIESTDDQNWTCIFYAAAYKNESIIRLLIDRGANLKHMDLKNRNLLHIAILENPDDFSFLKNHSLYVGRVSREIIKMLIDKGVDINATDINGSTLIITAFSANYINRDIIALLLCQRDIDLSKPDINGTTVLHRIIHTGFKKSHFSIFMLMSVPLDLLQSILSRLIEVDINARDKKGRTPLQLINEDSLEYLGELLDLGADTESLHYLQEDIFKNECFLGILRHYQFKRSIAGLGNNQNIDFLLNRYGAFWKKKNIKYYITVYSDEIKEMKNTILHDQLTYYDFLHAKKRTCIKIAKIPGMRETLIEYKHNFFRYVKMLAKNYLYGARPFTPIESDAVISAENNLDILFNNNLPSLVLYNIKKYLDIEDMVTLKNMNLLCNNENEKP